VSEKNAQSYRNELEALLRRAEDDGYLFNLKYEVEMSRDGYDVKSFETEYYFSDGYRMPTDVAHINSSLVWEWEA